MFDLRKWINHAKRFSTRKKRRDPSDQPPQNTRVTVEDGRTVVYVTLRTADGTHVVKHSFPPSIRHHYSATETGEDIPLCSGRFFLSGDQSNELVGDVRFMWNPTARVVARGSVNTPLSDALFEDTGSAEWVRMGDVVVDTQNGIPPPPHIADASWQKQDFNTWIEDRIATPDLGDGSSLDYITFFVPNGWQSTGGSRVQHRERPWVWWDGAFTATAAGWQVKIEPTAPHNSEFWKSLGESGSSRVTHVAQLSRQDNARFVADDAKQPLNAVRLGLSLAVGRSVQCLLPVGWQDDIPVWTHWHSGGVDRMKGVHSILDQTVAHDQLRQLIERCLMFSTDSFREEVLQYAISYYITANFDVNAELAVALPVSALQMLAYYRFVELQSLISKRRWEELTTGDQIRMLLVDCSVDLTVPAGFQYLESVRSALGPRSDGTGRDALDCVIRMRNNIIHPTRDKPAVWDPYQWTEASQIVLDYLRLAILNSIGYDSVLRTAAQPSKYVGQTTTVPWRP